MMRVAVVMALALAQALARAQAQAVATRPYTLGLFELVTELAATAGDIQHPLIQGPEKVSPEAKPLTLVLNDAVLPTKVSGPPTAQALETPAATRAARIVNFFIW